MRGYYGMSGTTSFYSTPDRKLNTHKWQNHSKILTAREWPEAWIGIDGDAAETQLCSRSRYQYNINNNQTTSP